MSSARIDDFLTLHEPNGHQFDVIALEVTVARGGPAEASPDASASPGATASPATPPAAPDVRLLFDTGWETYDREVEIFNLFHSSPEVRGDGPPDGFIEGKQVRVEVRLGAALAREHFADASAEDVATRLLALRDEDLDHPLLETEAWYLVAATQALDLPPDAPEDSSLREGYRTQWADGLPS